MTHQKWGLRELNIRSIVSSIVDRGGNSGGLDIWHHDQRIEALTKMDITCILMCYIYIYINHTFEFYLHLCLLDYCCFFEVYFHCDDCCKWNQYQLSIIHPFFESTSGDRIPVILPSPWSSSEGLRITWLMMIFSHLMLHLKFNMGVSNN